MTNSSDDEQARTRLLRWLKGRWLGARYWRCCATLAAGGLTLASIFASFAASIMAAVNPSFSPLATAIVAGIPAVCLTILRQFPIADWARLQITRYMYYREIWMLLDSRQITVPTATKQINEAGRVIANLAISMADQMSPRDDVTRGGAPGQTGKQMADSPI